MNRAILRLSSTRFYARLHNVRHLMMSKYLLLTNTGITICFCSFGDYLQQRYEIGKKRLQGINWKRTSHIAATGLTIGPACHYWYHYLDRLLPGRTLAIITKKILLDGFLFSPVVISLFFVTIGLLEASPWRQIQNEVVYKGSKIYVAEWIVWTPVQYVNFYYLPTRLRVLFDNIISLCFDCYYSSVKHSKDGDGVSHSVPR